jgi:2',3'-cyclic-nucleotide 2'-phosphodiesterase (5'-nucleotidase family)
VRDAGQPRDAARVIQSSAQLLELLEEPRPQDRIARVDELCAGLVARADAAMREVVGELATPLTASGKPYSTVAGSWMADLMRARTGADVAFHNRGGVRAEIDAGPVTRREVFEMSPFDNNVAILRLRGAELESLVRAAVDGRVHSGLDYSGAQVNVRETRDKAAVALTFESLEVGGKPLDPQAWYTVATNSFLAGGGDGFEVLANCAERREDPLLLRELAELELRTKGVVTPLSDARIVAVGERP